MTIDEVLLLLKATIPNPLTSLQEMILRSSWEGKTYTNIAARAHYGEERVRKVASNLWQLLSTVCEEPINKSNFRQVLESQRLTKAQQQLIDELNPTAINTTLEFPAGPVSLDSGFYISRPPIEEMAKAQISKPGSAVYIQAPRKMGKTSLLLRIIDHARNNGLRVVNLDFQQAEQALFADLDKFLRWLCANVSRELGLEPKLNLYWDEEMGSKISCSLYFKSYLLAASDTPLVLILNEVDWVLEYPDIARDFFPLLRSWYEQGKHIEVWQKLRLVLAASVEILSLPKSTQSQFGIGFTLRLAPFNDRQVKDLAQLYGLNWIANSQIQDLMVMLGGHPFLVRLAFYHLIRMGAREEDLEEILQKAPTEEGIYNQYLQQYLLALTGEPELEKAFFRVVAATKPVYIEPMLAYRLQSMGLIYLYGDRAYPACELFRIYFRKKLQWREQSKHTGIKQFQKENQQLRFLSTVDELTQLANRRYFDNYLCMEWQHSISQESKNTSGSYPIHISLILCDIDYFKIYNHTYGRVAGNDRLQQIANVIRNFARNPLANHNFLSQGASNIDNFQINHSYSDNFQIVSAQITRSPIFVARYSGEKFAILATIDSTAALYIGEYIRQTIKNLAIPYESPKIGEQNANVLTVSVGVASTIPTSETEPTTLTEKAEAALNKAKKKGRDQVILG